MLRFPCIYLLIIGAVCGLGCSGHPRPPKPPEISPAESAKQAVELYDKDGNGQLSKQEYEASPALKVAAERIDSDGNGTLSAEEIAARIDFWLHSGTTIMSGNTLVTYRGVPLAGAQLTYVPEPFLGPSFQPGSGTTDDSGVAQILGHDAEYPGVYVGLYRVKVSKVAGGKETLPAKYNEETELGIEISDDVYFESGMVRFEL